MAYYSNAHVRRRIAEFMAPGLAEIPFEENAYEMWERLVQARKVDRPLWDSSSILAVLHVGCKGSITQDEAVEAERPLADAVANWLAAYDIRPLHLWTGCSHTYLWRVAVNSAAFNRLAQSDSSVSSPTTLGALGQALLLVTERLLGESCGSQRSEAATITPANYWGPAEKLTTPVPYTLSAANEELAVDFPDRLICISIPLAVGEEPDLSVSRDIFRCAQLAGRTSSRIPDQSESFGRLLDDLARSIG